MAITLDGTTGIITPDLAVDTNTLFVDAANNRVGIGTVSPADVLDVAAAADGGIRLTDSTNEARFCKITQSAARLTLSADPTNAVATSYINFSVDGAEHARIDASGALLVGTTDANNNNSDGVRVKANGTVEMRSTQATANSGQLLILDRRSTDGPFINFKTAPSTTVGSIKSVSGVLAIEGVVTTGPLLRIMNTSTTVLTMGASYNSAYGYIGDESGGSVGVAFLNVGLVPVTAGDGALADNTFDIGAASGRWDDIFATNGTIQTSDRNEKQDIEALSDAEQRVAVACKGLLRKFRWKDAVAEKGEDARIHFGIIAQDLQDAFAAEGLDAGRYAMFISSTWWETQTEVPAVEAIAEVRDEDGNVVTEAVQAKEAYTRTDTYETLDEAPEGATERTRLGVRYPELLAFIIAAI